MIELFALWRRLHEQGAVGILFKVLHEAADAFMGVRAISSGIGAVVPAQGPAYAFIDLILGVAGR